MGFGFRKSFKIAPGVKLNTGKRGASLSVGGKGLTANISKRGTRTTASIPGTGLSYTSTSTRKKVKPQSPKRETVEIRETVTIEPQPAKRSWIGTIFMWIGIIFTVLFVIGLFV